MKKVILPIFMVCLVLLASCEAENKAELCRITFSPDETRSISVDITPQDLSLADLYVRAVARTPRSYCSLGSFTSNDAPKMVSDGFMLLSQGLWDFYCQWKIDGSVVATASLNDCYVSLNTENIVVEVSYVQKRGTLDLSYSAMDASDNLSFQLNLARYSEGSFTSIETPPPHSEINSISLSNCSLDSGFYLATITAFTSGSVRFTDTAAFLVRDNHATALSGRTGELNSISPSTPPITNDEVYHNLTEGGNGSLTQTSGNISYDVNNEYKWWDPVHGTQNGHISNKLVAIANWYVDENGNKVSYLDGPSNTTIIWGGGISFETRNGSDNDKESYGVYYIGNRNITNNVLTINFDGSASIKTNSMSQEAATIRVDDFNGQMNLGVSGGSTIESDCYGIHLKNCHGTINITLNRNITTLHGPVLFIEDCDDSVITITTTNDYTHYSEEASSILIRDTDNSTITMNITSKERSDATSAIVVENCSTSSVSITMGQSGGTSITSPGGEPNILFRNNTAMTGLTVNRNGKNVTVGSENSGSVNVR